MGRSFNNYKQNLNEQEQKLQEIGQLVQPYTIMFDWSEQGNIIKTQFKDEQDNLIEILFHRFKQNSNSFEAEFMINKQSIEAFKTSTKHFFKIISTVVYATNNFIEKFEPSQIFIEGSDKLGKEGQKNKIWLQYFKVNIKGNNYSLGTIGDTGFSLQKRSLN